MATVSIIKDFGNKQKRVSIRTNCYGSSLQMIMNLFYELKKDFPKAHPAKVEVVQYGGPRIKHIWGIEYEVKNPKDVPSEYDQWGSLEITRSQRLLKPKRHRFVKMHCPRSNHGLIRTRGFGNTLGDFLIFFQELLKDFPSLKMEDTSLKIYAGDSYPYSFGMEFEIPEGSKVPASYQKIEQLEYVL